MWCVAPDWPEHARHVAVEFVHPVIMGKRALPSVAIDGGKRDHDAADDGAVRRHPRRGRPERRRCRARRDATSAGVGSARRLDRRGPEPAARGSPIISSGSTGAVGRSPATTDRWCCAYHVLWELVARVLRAPGLLRWPDRRVRRSTGTCITCSDEGPPGRGRHDRRRRAGVGAHRAPASRRSTRRSSDAAPPGTSCSSTPAWPSRGWSRRRERPVRGPTSSTRSSRATSATRVRCSPISPGRRKRSVTSSRRAADADTRGGKPRSSPTSPTAMAGALRTRAGGCSRSATEAAPPTPRRSPRCSARLPAGRPLPPAASPTTRRCSPRWRNDVGFELVFSRQLIAHGRPVTSRSGSRRVADRATCSRAFAEASRRGHAHGRLGRLRRRRDGAVAATSTTASSCASDSVHRIQEAQAALGVRSVVERAATALEPPWLTTRDAGDREAAVFERIEAFRRRRPALTRRGRHARPRCRREGVGRTGRRRLPSTRSRTRRWPAPTMPPC